MNGNDGISACEAGCRRGNRTAPAANGDNRSPAWRMKGKGGEREGEGVD